MKRESLLLVLTVANILFLIMSVCCLIWTAKNNQIFNSIEKDFSYEEYENGKVILSLKGGKKMTLIFGSASVKVVDSYQATSKEESISVALFIRYYTRLNGIETARSNTDFGNGRYVRNIFEQAKMNQASRLLEKDFDDITSDEITTITAEDIILFDHVQTPALPKD